MIYCLKHKIEYEHSCEQCSSPPPIPLYVAMETLYKENKPHKILYVSDIEGNLNNIHKHFNENVELNNLNCTITLTFTSGCKYLKNTYSHIFLDADINLQDPTISNINILDHIKLKFVDPSKQHIVDN